MRGFFKAMAAIIAACFVSLFLIFTVSVVRWTYLAEVGANHDHISVIDISGVILSASSTLKELRNIEKDPYVKAIVVRINSPGGAVSPSQEILEGLKRIDRKIPVIVSLQTVAASGGYYIALGGRKLFASPGTLTGSIGVIMEFVNLEKLFQWAKIERYDLKAGKFKDMGSMNRPMTSEERMLIQDMLNDVAAQFKAEVKRRRKLTDEELNLFADGRVLTGRQAIQLKLIDSIGGFEDAAKEAKQLAHLPEDAEIVFPERPHGLLKELLTGESDAEEEASPVGGLSGILTGTLPPSLLFYQGWKVMALSPVR